MDSEDAMNAVIGRLGPVSPIASAPGQVVIEEDRVPLVAATYGFIRDLLNLLDDNDEVTVIDIVDDDMMLIGETYSITYDMRKGRYIRGPGRATPDGVT